jgi:hypothetical protein
LKQRKNKNKQQDKQNKFTYKQPQKPEQIPTPKKLRRSGETEKQKGKRPASENENLTQYNTPTKRSKTRSQAHSAEDHKKKQPEKQTHARHDRQPRTSPRQTIHNHHKQSCHYAEIQRSEGTRRTGGVEQGENQTYIESRRKDVQERKAQRINI